MMRLLTGILLLLTSQAVVLAHPGIGIVSDSRGVIYYTDLSRVWRISPDGKKTIAVPEVHTHELWFDSLDNLYGEHLWYEGDATGKWGHRIWKRSPDGAVTDVIPSRTGFRDDYDDFHFAWDRSENMYWTDGDSVTVIRKRAPGGTATDLARRTIRRAGWMTISRSGTVFLVDGADLIAVSADGAVRTVARGVTADESGRAPADERHSVMGLWMDRQENIYVALPVRGCVKRISPDGAVTVPDRSASPWKPSGGLFAANGDLWILEFSPANAVRARQVGPNGVPRIH